MIGALIQDKFSQDLDADITLYENLVIQNLKPKELVLLGFPNTTLPETLVCLSMTGICIWFNFMLAWNRDTELLFCSQCCSKMGEPQNAEPPLGRTIWQNG